LNNVVDHNGQFLTGTAEAFEIIDRVNAAEVGIVYDLYHSAVMGERVDAVPKARMDKIFHVHIADHPGRGEPGSGQINLRDRIHWLLQQGYCGMIGLEFRPTRETRTVLPELVAWLKTMADS
jgi:hydroxypyruvate isomerase